MRTKTSRMCNIFNCDRRRETTAALIAGTSGQKSVKTLVKTTRSSADMRALLSGKRRPAHPKGGKHGN